MNHKLLLAILMISGMLLAGCADGNKVYLFNGKDLSNWEISLFEPDAIADEVFRVEDGVIKVSGVPNGSLVTKESYSNYKLHVEWRWTEEPANSGVLLHVQEDNSDEWPLCIEAQLENGSAGNIVLIGHGAGISVGDSVYYITPDVRRYKSSPRIEESSELAAGEWNTYEITCSGAGVELVVNGVLQNVGFDAVFEAGRIGLQSEGGAMEFREVYLVPIPE